jgi:hypothetical protein
MPQLRAIGSAGERLVHTEEVTGSIPVSPTAFGQLRGTLYRSHPPSRVRPLAYLGGFWEVRFSLPPGADGLRTVAWGVAGSAAGWLAALRRGARSASSSGTGEGREKGLWRAERPPSGSGGPS